MSHCLRASWDDALTPGAGGLGLLGAAPIDSNPASASALASESRLGSLADKLTTLKGDAATKIMTDTEMSEAVAEVRGATPLHRVVMPAKAIRNERKRQNATGGC